MSDEETELRHCHTAALEWTEAQGALFTQKVPTNLVARERAAVRATYEAKIAQLVSDVRDTLNLTSDDAQTTLVAVRFSLMDALERAGVK